MAGKMDVVGGWHHAEDGIQARQAISAPVIRQERQGF
jgi:hypothetical protein